MDSLTTSERMAKIRVMLEELINRGELGLAEAYIREYEKIIENDVDIISLKAVVQVMNNNLEEAEKTLLLGLELDENNFDILFNLGYVYEHISNYNEALRFYKEALLKCDNDIMKENILRIIENIKLNHKDVINEDRKKLAFFVKKGMDSFIKDIIILLSHDYEIKKIVVNNNNQIDEGIIWADICWFEWCDELIIYASKKYKPFNKKIICRLHSYEAFTDFPKMVNWDNVDKIIFSAEHIRDVVLSHVSIHKNKIEVIPVGVDIDKFSYSERKEGFNIAYVGYINYKKGPMLLIQLINELVRKDKRYKLFIGGKFQDERDILYFNQMIEEFNIKENIVYEGWIEDVNSWLEDKNYIVSTSLLEGQHLSVMEGMCKGIKPIIHNFVGAKGVYKNEYVWNTLDEAVNMILSKNYISNEYRSFVMNNYNNKIVINTVSNLLKKLIATNLPKKNYNDGELVTIGIINYNYNRFLDKAMGSVLEQSYKNIEILIVDDCSTDGSIEKIKTFEEKYKNIRGIFHIKNSGSAVLAFQEIIKESNGKYFYFLSADDYLASNEIIEHYVSCFENDEKLDYVYGNIRVVDVNDQYKNTWKYQDYTDNEIIYKTFIRMGSGVIPFTIGLFKKDFYVRNNLTWVHDENNIVAGDVLNTLINIKYNWKIKYIDIDALCYRHHDNNMTYNLKQRIGSILSVIIYITKNFSEEIYFPNIDWRNIVDSKEKQATKFFLIGSFLNDIYNYYYLNEFKPWDGKILNYSKEELKDFLQPITKEIENCFKVSLSLSDKYREKITFIMNN